MGTEDNSIQRRSITLPEPMSNRGSYSEPGYYIVDQTGNPISDRFDSPSLAFANLRGGAGVQYLDQPQGGHLNQPWPPELHTVVGHTQGEQMPQYTEADLLRAMASTNDLDEQRYLMGALEEVRRDTRQVMAGAEQVDFDGPHHVGEERSFYPYHSGAFGSSTATDWLAEMGASNDGMQEHMLTMGSRFFIGCHPEVKADPVEYMTQALGVARVAAGQYEDVEGAVNIFMDHVANLARVDMTKIAVDQLLPWDAPPEKLPPISTDEYSGPYSADQNTEKNTDPPNDETPGLDNGESGRAVMGGLSVLSSHPHISEFLFDPPTPEELAAASGPGNINQQFGSPATSQDQTPEPNDDGALSGALEGNGPVVASHTAEYKYIDSDNNIHKHVEGKGPLEGPIISHHDSREEAEDSFKAMMMNKHGGSLNCQCQELHGNFVLRNGQHVSTFIDKTNCTLHNGSRAQSPQQATYEEYLARLSPGGAPVSREFFSGAMAAHSPSENDPSVPEWGRRQGPKVAVTERPTKFRGVTPRTAANEDMLNPQAFERAVDDDAPALRPQPSGTYDPDTAHEQSGEAAHDITGLIPQGDLGETWSNISDFPDTGEAEVPSTRAPNVARRTAARSVAGRDVDESHLKKIINQGRAQHGEKFDSSSLADASHLAPFYTTGTRLKVRRDYGDGEYHERTGTVGKTTGWKPSFLLMHRSSDTGSSDTLGPEDEIVGIHNGRNYSPVRYADQFGTVPGTPNRPSYPPQREGAKPKEYNQKPGFETGGTGENTPGAFEPDRSGYSESPQGVADDSEEYEQAYSSGRPIDWSGTGETTLGTVPVQGYLQDAEHPNAEMWPWETGPIGSPPRGAADVADVPTPGEISAQQTGSSWPQPNVTKNSKLDAFRANIASRMGARDPDDPVYRGRNKMPDLGPQEAQWPGSTAHHMREFHYGEDPADHDALHAQMDPEQWGYHEHVPADDPDYVANRDYRNRYDI